MVYCRSISHYVIVSESGLFKTIRTLAQRNTTDTTCGSGRYVRVWCWQSVSQRESPVLCLKSRSDSDCVVLQSARYLCWHTYTIGSHTWHTHLYMLTLTKTWSNLLNYTKKLTQERKLSFFSVKLWNDKISTIYVVHLTCEPQSKSLKPYDRFGWGKDQNLSYWLKIAFSLHFHEINSDLWVILLSWIFKLITKPVNLNDLFTNRTDLVLKCNTHPFLKRNSPSPHSFSLQYIKK